MGYDMRWRKKDEAEASAVAAASDQFHAAVRDRNSLPEDEKGRFNMERAKELGDWDSHEVFDGRSDRYRAAQDRVSALADAMRDAEQSYFRLNISGMGWARGVMDQFGMVFEDPSDRPGWPKPEEFGTTYDDVDALECPEYYTDKQWDDVALRATLAYKPGAGQDPLLARRRDPRHPVAQVRQQRRVDRAPGRGRGRRPHLEAGLRRDGRGCGASRGRRRGFSPRTAHVCRGQRRLLEPMASLGRLSRWLRAA